MVLVFLRRFPAESFVRSLLITWNHKTIQDFVCFHFMLFSNDFSHYWCYADWLMDRRISWRFYWGFLMRKSGAFRWGLFCRDLLRSWIFYLFWSCLFRGFLRVYVWVILLRTSINIFGLVYFDILNVDIKVGKSAANGSANGVSKFILMGLTHPFHDRDLSNASYPNSSCVYFVNIEEGIFLLTINDSQ